MFHAKDVFKSPASAVCLGSNAGSTSLKPDAIGAWCLCFCGGSCASHRLRLQIRWRDSRCRKPRTLHECFLSSLPMCHLNLPHHLTTDDHAVVPRVAQGPLPRAGPWEARRARILCLFMPPPPSELGARATSSRKSSRPGRGPLWYSRPCACMCVKNAQFPPGLHS